MTALTRREVMDARRRPGPLGPGYVPEKRGHVGRVVRWGQGDREKPAAVFPPRKEQAPCCMALVDELGRPPIGFCTPECVRRPGNWALVVEGKPIPPGGVPFRALTANQPTPKEDPRWA